MVKQTGYEKVMSCNHSFEFIDDDKDFSRCKLCGVLQMNKMETNNDFK